MKCPKCGEEISETNIMPEIISTGEQFEQFLCDRINAQEGMCCRKTKASGDQGVDLIVELGGKKVAIQCKLYSDTVGNDAVQEVLAGRIMYKCDIGCVVTNSTYTDSAKELAKGTDIILLHYKDLLSYLRSLNGEASRFREQLQEWIAQVPNDNNDLNYQSALKEFTDKVVDAILKNPDVCLPTQDTYFLFMFRSAAIAIEAQKASCLLIEERWMRYASLFSTLAGVGDASQEFDKMAKELFKERYKSDKFFNGENCNVPTDSCDVGQIFSSFAYHWYHDEYRILYAMYQREDISKFTKEQQEAYAEIKKNYEIRKAELDKDLMRLSL